MKGGCGGGEGQGREGREGGGRHSLSPPPMRGVVVGLHREDEVLLCPHIEREKAREGEEGGR